MGELDQTNKMDGMSRLNEVLPFMSAFPFPEYEIEFIEEDGSSVSSGVSPIILEALGGNETIGLINFYYFEHESDVAISIYLDTIEWIAEESVNVKKMDALRSILDEALGSKDLTLKIKAIKESRKFTKILNCEEMVGLDFNQVLVEFLRIYDVALTSKIKMGLQRLSEAAVKSTEFSEKQYCAAKAFLDFQAHYAKILLGIVIATKIY